jgi:hypothetical protein
MDAPTLPELLQAKTVSRDLDWKRGEGDNLFEATLGGTVVVVSRGPDQVVAGGHVFIGDEVAHLKMTILDVFPDI